MPLGHIGNHCSSLRLSRTCKKITILQVLCCFMKMESNLLPLKESECPNSDQFSKPAFATAGHQHDPIRSLPTCFTSHTVNNRPSCHPNGFGVMSYQLLGCGGETPSHGWKAQRNKPAMQPKPGIPRHPQHLPQSHPREQ